MPYTPDPNGLYRKFQVTRVSDGADIDPAFCLLPQDPHARKAMAAYADSVADENPTLASDLRAMIEAYGG